MINDNKKVYIFSCAPETGELIASMSKHIEGGTEAIFQQGILLVGLALKANKQGNKLAIVDKDNNIVDTIEGIANV
jgi:hypothetical protein